MKRITSFILEKLIINKNTKVNNYHYHPKTSEELIQTVYKLIRERGKDADLNDIDTSEITEMRQVFGDNDVNKSFNGDISQWDVSNVKDMTEMFYHSKFNGDISKWNVNDDTNMKYMFDNCPLEKNPPKWYKPPKW